MVNKLYLTILLALFLVLPLISAGTIGDYTKSPTDKYGTIELKSHTWIDVFGWFDEKVMDLTLEKNTETCSYDCSANIPITLYEDGALIDSIKFETILKDGTRREEPINSYKFLIKTGEKEVNDYKEVCSKGKDLNDIYKGYSLSCENKLVGTHLENIYEEYKEGTKLKAGDYYLKLEGDKIAKKTVDWIITSQGKELTEWAIWNPSTIIVSQVSNPFPIGGITSSTGKDGMKIITNKAITIINFTKYSDETATHGYILDASKNVLASASYVGNVVTLNYDLTAGTSYYLANYADGSAFNMRYNTGVTTYPVVGTPFNWTGALDTLQTDTTAAAFAIDKVTVGELTQSTNGNVTLISPVNIYNSSSQSVIFNITTQGHNTTIKNISLLIQNGIWNVNKTQISSALEFDTTQTFSDGSYNWTAYVCDIDGDCAYPSANRTFSIDSTNPTISIITPTGNQGIQAIPYNITLNYTASDTNLQSCWYNTSLSATLVYTPCNITNITSITDGGTNRIYVYANDSFGNVGVSYTTFYNSFSIDSVTYASPVVDSLNSAFGINGIKDSSILSLTSYLNYSGTLYLASGIQSGNTYNATRIITIPSGQGYRNFSWHFVATNSTETFTLNSDTYVQKINSVSMVYCNNTSPSGLSLNFTTFDSANDLRLNSSFEANFNYVASGGTGGSQLNFSDTLQNKSNWMFCLNASGYNATVSATISYLATGYDRREYILSNAEVGNFIQNIPLFLAATTTTDVVTIRVVDQNYNALPGAIVNIQEWNIGTNTYDTIGMVTTSSTGQGIMNLELYNIWYRAVITYNGQIVETTQVQKLSGTTWQIIVSLGTTNPYPIFDNIPTTLTFNNLTNITTFSFADTSGYTQTGCLNVYNSTALGYELINQECVNSNSGIIDYLFTSNGNYWVTGNILLNSNGSNANQQTNEIFVRLGTGTITKTVSPYGKVVSLMLIGTSGLLGVSLGSPIFGIMLLIGSIIGSMKMGFLNIAEGTIWSIVVICIVILFRMSRRGG